MNEIRFGHPNTREGYNQNDWEQEKAPKKNKMKKILVSFLVFVFGVVIIFVLWTSLPYIKGLFGGGVSKNDYYAFFLTNNQVYFGKILKETKDEMVITNIFYFAPPQNGSIEATQTGGLKLVKMGNEIHGPEDKMFINKEHLILYEILKKDSKVVSSINQYK